MRILLVTHFFPPKHTAGTENYTLGLARALQENGHKVQVLCAEDWDHGQAYWNDVTDEVYQGIQVRRIHLNWLQAKDPNRVLYESDVVNQWMVEFLKHETFDVVHVTSTLSLGVGILRAVKQARIPLVLTLMDFWFLCPSIQLLRSDGTLCHGVTTASECQACLMDSSGVAKRLNRLGVSASQQQKLWDNLVIIPTLRKTRGFRGMLLDMRERKALLKTAIELPDLVISHSNTVRDMFSAHTSRPIVVLRNGHDLTWLQVFNGKSIHDKVRIVYTGQLTEIKGVHILVAAFKKANISEQAQLDIWGDLQKDPDYVHRLNNLIAGDGSIMLRGRFERNNLANVFEKTDVLVVPSIWYENAPLVIQEAFATKTPVIASDLGGMSEAITHQIDGLLFEVGNIDDLAGQLIQFVTHATLRNSLIAGIKPVKHISQEVSELERLYETFGTTHHIEPWASENSKLN